MLCFASHFISVFPAQAGVILSVANLFKKAFGLSRASGGDPKEIYAQGTEKESFPRERG